MTETHIQIQIGNSNFTHVRSLRIEQSVCTLSDAAELLIAISEPPAAIAAGALVQIRIGYTTQRQRTLFRGQVVGHKLFMSARERLVKVFCKDRVSQLEDKCCSRLFVDATLQGIMQYILQGTQIQLSQSIPVISLRRFLLKGLDGVQALQKLKTTFGLYLYLGDQNELKAEFQYCETGQPVVNYPLQENIYEMERDEAIDKSFSCKVIAFLDDNNRLSAQRGVRNGRCYTFRRYGLQLSSNSRVLDHLVRSKHKALQYQSYRPAIRSGLDPFVNRGMQANLYRGNQQIESRFVLGVTTTWSQEKGAERYVTLSEKI